MRMAVVLLLVPLILQEALHGLGDVLSVRDSLRWAGWWVALPVLVFFINIHGQTLVLLVVVMVVTTGGRGTGSHRTSDKSLAHTSGAPPGPICDQCLVCRMARPRRQPC